MNAQIFQIDSGCYLSRCKFVKTNEECFSYTVIDLKTVWMHSGGKLTGLREVDRSKNGEPFVEFRG